MLAWVRLDELVARVYHAMHSYRDHVGVLFAVFFVRFMAEEEAGYSQSDA